MIGLMLLVLAVDPSGEAVTGTRLLNIGERHQAAVHFRTALKGATSPAVRPIAQHGLALCLLATDRPDWKEILELLHGTADDSSYPDRGDVLELLGVVYRARATTEGDGDRWASHRWFTEAANWFVDKKRLADAARCWCAAAELNLRLNDARAARATTEAFLKNRELARTPSGGRGLHLYALASLRLNDPTAAERAAGRVLASDPAFADAQLILGKLRQRAGDPTEAIALFHAAGDRPDAQIHLAMLAFEGRRYGEALTALQKLPGDDAAVWAGATLVRLGRFAEAVAVLKSLKPQEPHLPDQVARWLGEAQIGMGQSDEGLANLRTAVELASKVPEHLDPACRTRRQDNRFTLADALLRAGRFNEAADLFRRLWDEGTRPKRRDELLARQVAALRLADKSDHAETRAVEFRRLYPTSPHLAEVARHHAELAVARALAVGPDPRRRDELRLRVEQAIERCQLPELADDPVTRVGLAAVLRRAGRFAEAAEAVKGVSGATELRGDCLLRAGNATAAVQALERAASVAGQFALGHALLQVGRSATARDVFARIPTSSDPALVVRAKADRAIAAWRAGDRTAESELAGMTRSSAATVHLTTIRLENGNNSEAVRLLREYRDHLPDGTTEAEKRLLAYQHGLALVAAGQWSEARKVFEPMVGSTRGTADSAAFSRRSGECLLASAVADLSAKPTDATRNRVRIAADELLRRAEQLRDQPDPDGVRPYLFLLALHTFRTLATAEVTRAWEQERRHRRYRWAEQGDHDPPPEVTRSEVPLQWAEQRVLEVAKRLSEVLPATPHAAVARLEASALLAEHGRYGVIAGLLSDSVESGLSREMLARQRVFLADALVARNELPSAIAAIAGVTDPVATDRLAALQLASGEMSKAIEACGSEPSLRLGEALAVAGRLEQAATVFAQLNGSAARYGSGWVAVQRGRFDEAAENLKATSDPRARLLLGLVQATQQQRDAAVATLLSNRVDDGVPAELEWACRLEACRLLGDREGLQRLFLDLPRESDWAIAAAERLTSHR